MEEEVTSSLLKVPQLYIDVATSIILALEELALY